jgi:hypothetical protein
MEFNSRNSCKSALQFREAITHLAEGIFRCFFAITPYVAWTYEQPVQQAQALDKKLLGSIVWQISSGSGGQK